MNYKLVKAQVLAFLNKWLYQWLIKKIFGRALFGVKGWIVSLAFDYLWGKAIKPVALWIFRKAQVAWQKRENNKKLKRLHDSQTEFDFDNSSDDIP